MEDAIGDAAARLQRAAALVDRLGCQVPEDNLRRDRGEGPKGMGEAAESAQVGRNIRLVVVDRSRADIARVGVRVLARV